MEPSDYFSEGDSTAATLSEVKERLDRITAYAANRNLQVFWRGQVDHRWGLTSSLVRQLSAVVIPDDKLLNRVEDTLLAEAGRWIADLNQPQFAQPLGKLAYMQHHGVPTRLLDFTRDPWMAVFFAVESKDEVDGRVFAILLEAGQVIAAAPTGTPWRTYNTNQIKIWDPAAAGIAFPRLQAQNGVLAVGRLPSTTPHRTGYDQFLKKKRSLLAEEVRRILSIPFKLSKLDPAIPPGAVPPVGLTFRIHVDKESVRRDLAGGGQRRRICPTGVTIAHRNVYPDAAGMVSNSTLIQGLRKGVIVL